MGTYHTGTQIRQIFLHLGRGFPVEFAIPVTGGFHPFITDIHQSLHRTVKIRLQVVPDTIQLYTYRFLFLAKIEAKPFGTTLSAATAAPAFKKFRLVIIILFFKINVAKGSKIISTFAHI